MDSLDIVAGCTSRTAVAPLERLKILYQVQDFVAVPNGNGGVGSPKKYGTVLASLRKIGAEEGFRGYFKGNGANCVRVFPYAALQFAVFERMKPILQDENQQLSPMKKLIGGSTAGVVSVLFTYPLDFVRARLTVQGGLSSTQYSGIMDALRGTYRTEGVRGMYRGVMPTIWGVAPYAGLNFMVFQSLRDKAPLDINGHPDMLYILGCGAVAGACGQTAAYPLDLLRRRFQMSSLRPEGGAAYKSTLSGLSAIVREEGVLGLYKGLLPNFIKVVPSIAIMFTTNELLKQVF